MVNEFEPTDFDERGLPHKTGPHNLWYRYSDTDTALILVHGVLSNVRTCWLSEEGSYWPQLILDDRRLPPMGIYLGGYATGILSGEAGIRGCADQLLQALKVEDPHSRPPVISKRRLIFICHSLGGVIVRYVLERYWQEFQRKEIVLVLIASPSYGSGYANTIRLLTRYFRHTVGKQLEWGSETLDELDDRWKTAIGEKRIPALIGIEAYEEFFPVLFLRWFFRPKKVVTKEAAARYFPNPRFLWHTDHFTSVKPNDQNHPAHMLLVELLTAGLPHVLKVGPPAQDKHLSEEVLARLTRTAAHIDQLHQQAGNGETVTRLCAELEAIRLCIEAHEALFVELTTRLTGDSAISNDEHRRSCGKAIQTYLGAQIISPKLEGSIGALEGLIDTPWFQQDHQDLVTVGRELAKALADFHESLGSNGLTGLGVGQEDKWNLTTLVKRTLYYGYGGSNVDLPIAQMASQVLRNHDWRLTHRIHRLVGKAKALANCAHVE